MKTQIHNQIAEAITLLNADEIVAIPTETVYGLAANAFHPEAVMKIFQTKQRPLFNPLILHIGRIEQLPPLIQHVPPAFMPLMTQFWPGPLTFLLPKSSKVHDLVTAGSPMVAVRMPNHPLTLSLLRNIDYPLAAPSANLFGTISPTTAQHVAEQFEGIIPMVLDGGPCQVGLESTIIREDNGRIEILRAGGITPEMLEEASGQPPIINNQHTTTPEAPGMLKSHYAPGTKLLVGDLDMLIHENRDKKLAVLNFGETKQAENIISGENLSVAKNLDEAALQLFSLLRKLDKSGADVMLAPILPASGLGYAINDRLARAAS